MDIDFFQTWFGGFQEGLENLNEDARSCLLKKCAKRCADTGVLASYRKHYENVNGDRDAFYSRIEELGGARGEVAVPGKEYYIYSREKYITVHLAR